MLHYDMQDLHKEKRKELVKEKREDRGMSVSLSVQALRVFDLSPSGSLHPNVVWKAALSPHPAHSHPRIVAPLAPMLLLTVTLPPKGALQPTVRHDYIISLPLSINAIMQRYASLPLSPCPR